MLLSATGRPYATTDSQRDRADPAKLGSPEHFRQFCRAYPDVTVQVFRRVEGFVVPYDGAWFVNRVWNPPGAERVLVEGDLVTFYPAGRAPDDDRPSRAAPRAQVNDLKVLRIDPISGKVIPRPLSPALFRR